MGEKPNGQPFMHADRNAFDLQVRGGDLLGAAIAP
jgi:hypothetical protein